MNIPRATFRAYSISESFWRSRACEESRAKREKVILSFHLSKPQCPVLASSSSCVREVAVQKARASARRRRSTRLPGLSMPPSALFARSLSLVASLTALCAASEPPEPPSVEDLIGRAKLAARVPDAAGADKLLVEAQALAPSNA